MHLELVVAKVVTVVLGLAIAVQAYRGYRRHDSWPMLYLAVGFGIISVGAVIEGILFEFVGLPPEEAGAIQTAIVAVGMLVVLYSLHGDAPIAGVGAPDEDERPPRRDRAANPDAEREHLPPDEEGES